MPTRVVSPAVARSRRPLSRLLLVPIVAAFALAPTATAGAQPSEELFAYLDFLHGLYEQLELTQDPTGDLTTRSGEPTANPLDHTDVTAVFAALVAFTGPDDAEAVAAGLRELFAAPDGSGPLVALPEADDPAETLGSGRDMLVVGATLAAPPPTPPVGLNLSLSWTRAGAPTYQGAEVDNEGFNAAVYAYWDGDAFVTDSLRFDGGFGTVPTGTIVIIDGRTAFVITPVDEFEGNTPTLIVGSGVLGGDSSYDTASVPVPAGPAHPFPPVAEPEPDVIEEAGEVEEAAPPPVSADEPADEPTVVTDAPAAVNGTFPTGLLVAAGALAVVVAAAAVLMAGRRKGPCDEILARIAEIDAFVAGLYERYFREVGDGNSQGADYCVRSAASNLANREQLVAQLAANECPPAGPPPAVPDGFPAPTVAGAAAVDDTTEVDPGTVTTAPLPPDHGPTAERRCRDGATRNLHEVERQSVELVIDIEIRLVPEGTRFQASAEDARRVGEGLQDVADTLGQLADGKLPGRAGKLQDLKGELETLGGKLKTVADKGLTELAKQELGAQLQQKANEINDQLKDAAESATDVPAGDTIDTIKKAGELARNPAKLTLEILRVTADLGSKVAGFSERVIRGGNLYRLVAIIQTQQIDILWQAYEVCTDGTWRTAYKVLAPPGPTKEIARVLADDVPGPSHNPRGFRDALRRHERALDNEVGRSEAQLSKALTPPPHR